MLVGEGRIALTLSLQGRNVSEHIQEILMGRAVNPGMNLCIDAAGSFGRKQFSFPKKARTLILMSFFNYVYRGAQGVKLTLYSFSACIMFESALVDLSPQIGLLRL